MIINNFFNTWMNLSHVNTGDSISEFFPERFKYYLNFKDLFLKNLFFLKWSKINF